MDSLNDFNKSLSAYMSILADDGVYHNPSISKVNAHDNYIDSIADNMAEYGGLDVTVSRTSSYVKGLADDGVYNLTLDSAKAVMYTVVAMQPPDGSYLLQTWFELSGPASAMSRRPKYGDMAFSHTSNIFISQTLAYPLPDQTTPKYWDAVARATYIVDATKAAARQGTKKWFSYQNYMGSRAALTPLRC